MHHNNFPPTHESMFIVQGMSSINGKVVPTGDGEESEEKKATNTKSEASDGLVYKIDDVPPW